MRAGVKPKKLNPGERILCLVNQLGEEWTAAQKIAPTLAASDLLITISRLQRELEFQADRLGEEWRRWGNFDDLG